MEMEDVQCSICKKFPIPAVYHCVGNHVRCSTCIPDPLEKLERCKCCKGQKNVHYCDTTTEIMSNMIVVCGNNKNGCTAAPFSCQEYNIHLQDCPFSKYICPICVDQNFDDVKTLKSRFEDSNIHELTTVAREVQKTFQMPSGQSLLLQEESTQDLFVLTLKMGSLALQHMRWDNPRAHNLTARDENKSWCFSGKTSKVLSPTPVVESPPGTFPFPEGKDITCDLVLGLKSDVNALLGQLTSTKALMCRICSEITTSPIYHCLNDHLICDKCRNGGASCKKCHGSIRKCETASSLVSLCDFDCPNKAKGCNQRLTLKDVPNHLKEECLKVSFSCPKCPKECPDLIQLREHLANHPSKKLRYGKGQDLTAKLGVNLMVEKDTNEYYVLILDGDELCIQHLYGAASRKYVLSFEDGNGTWSFQGETGEMERKPKITPGCFKLPIARETPNFPVGVSVLIRN